MIAVATLPNKFGFFSGSERWIVFDWQMYHYTDCIWRILQSKQGKYGKAMGEFSGVCWLMVLLSLTYCNMKRNGRKEYKE